MGYNATVMVLLDELGSIERDPEFGAKLAAAIKAKAVDPQMTADLAGASVVEVHHADNTTLVTVGGNVGIMQLEHFGYCHHHPVMQEKLLSAWADKLGFNLVKKP